MGPGTTTKYIWKKLCLNMIIIYLYLNYLKIWDRLIFRADRPCWYGYCVQCHWLTSLPTCIHVYSLAVKTMWLNHILKKNAVGLHTNKLLLMIMLPFIFVRFMVFQFWFSSVYINIYKKSYQCKEHRYANTKTYY